MRLLEFVLGVGPDAERAMEWVDERPWVAAVVMALAALAVVTADGWWS